MRNVVVFETSHHVHDCVGLPDIGEKLVAKALALRRACYKTRDVDKFHGRRNHLFRMDDALEDTQPWIGHRYDPDIGIDSTKRVVLGRNLGRR